MRNLIVPAFLALQFAVAAAVQAAQVGQVTVRQQWPWSTDVKVTFTLNDVSAPVDVDVHAYNGAEELNQAQLLAATKGDRYGLSAGEHELTIDPVKAFGAAETSLESFRVKILLNDSAPGSTEPLYKVINLDENPVTVTDICPADFYNGKVDPQYAAYTTDFKSMHKNNRTPTFDVFIWTGITNGDLYRTSKIALRKIPAAGQSFKMGEYEAPDTPPESSRKRDVSFTKDYWMGVFPITQAQLKHFKPEYVPYETNELYGATRAASKVSFDIARGTGGNKSWPKGNHSNVSATSFIGLLQQATGNARFDLPTEAQWEFAARAGSPYRFPSWFPDAQMTTAWWWYEGWFHQRGNTADFDRNCDLSLARGAYPPGQYLPNAWGLYDVMGNVYEQCLDHIWTDYSNRASGPDPRGTEEGNSKRIVRGGGFGQNIYDIGVYFSQDPWWDTSFLGFRLCLHGED